MNLNKKIKTIVITYIDEECVRLSGDEAEKFREMMAHLISINASTILAADGHKIIDLNNHFNYEIIRKPLSDNDIVNI